MVKLNLLPPEERTKNQVIKENFIAVVLMLLVVALMTGFSFYIFFLRSEIDNQIVEEEKKIEVQKKINDSYKETEDIVKSLNKNMNLLDTLKTQNVVWSEILNEVRQKMPQEVRFTDLITALEGENSKSGQLGTPVITIKGVSPALLSVARIRESLSYSSKFDYVDFESAVREDRSGEYQFIIKLKVKKAATGGK